MLAAALSTIASLARQHEANGADHTLMRVAKSATRCLSLARQSTTPAQKISRRPHMASRNGYNSLLWQKQRLKETSAPLHYHNPAASLRPTASAAAASGAAAASAARIRCSGLARVVAARARVAASPFAAVPRPGARVVRSASAAAGKPPGGRSPRGDFGSSNRVS